MKKTVYIDVTDFITWQGNFSGIQRVVYETGLRLAKSKSIDLKYVYYSDKTRQFFSVNVDVFTEAQKSRQGNAQDSSNDEQVLSARQKAMQFAKSTYRRLPDSIGRPAKRTYNYTRHHAGLFLNEYVRPATRFLKNRSTPREHVPGIYADHMTPLEITSADTFLILGQGWYGPKWYDPSLIRELAKLKREKRFALGILIHDTIPVSHPEFYSGGFTGVYDEFLFEGLIIADQVFTVSQSTRRDVEAYCADNYIKTPPITVVQLGDNFADAVPVKPYSVREKEEFVLAVGSFEIRKNYIVLYQAVKQAQLMGITLPKIVIVGRQGFLSRDLDQLIESDYSVKDTFVHFSHISDGELAWLYKNAMFTVYPSVYEGWGLPIAESLYNGKFCISSNTSSMPEVGGKLVDYVSPYDVVGWMEAIHKYASNKKLLREKTTAVEAHAKAPYSWDDTAKTIEKAL